MSGGISLHAARVSAWRTRIAQSGHLSSRFVDRYAVVLAGLEPAAPDHARAEAWAMAIRFPDRAARILAGVPGPLTGLGAIGTVSGPEPLASEVERLLSTSGAVWFPLAQTNVPLHPSRRAHGVCSVDVPTVDLVALVWPAESVRTRRSNELLMSEAVAQANTTAAIPMVISNQYAVMPDGDDGQVWVFAPNLGQTLEDRLRSDDFVGEERRLVVESLTTLRRAMLGRGVVWQGFAPRNMFLQDTKIVLIDFEEVADARQNPTRAAECLLWHRVFVADCLNEVETSRMFAADEQLGPHPDPDAVLPADPFERALLNATSTTWRERRALLQRSVSLEGRHSRPARERDRGVLHGHELGHFWGDFLAPEVEARIFSSLATVDDPAALVASLEVFEAAMEADICTALRDSVAGAEGRPARRTEATAEILDQYGPGPLTAARAAEADWYQSLRNDPVRLADGLLLRVGASPDGLDRSILDRYLIGSGDARKEHEASLIEALRTGLGFVHAGSAGGPILEYATPDTLRFAVASPLPREGAAFDEVLAEATSVAMRYSVRQSHPRYLAFPDSGNAVGAVAGSMMAPLLNQNLIAVDRSAPSATFMEIQVIEWLRELVGYPTMPLTAMRGVKDVAGLWTTGGHLSNHIAMLAALGSAFPQARAGGLRALNVDPVVIMSGPIAHYSHSDAAFHLGLGRDSVISVGARAGYTTDPDAAEKALVNLGEDRVPFMVVGVAGNCRTTGLDDLQALGDVCRRHGVWFHVDACHGGSLIFNDRLRRRFLDGIELADSVSLDPHKGLFTPYPSSYVVFRERGVLTQFSRHTAAVLDDDCWDLGLVTPFLGSRGFESLATWMLLRHVGAERLGQLVEARQALVRYLERRIADTGLFVCLNDVDFYRLAFVFCPPAARAAVVGLSPNERSAAARTISAYTSRLNTTLYRSGQVCFDEHTLADLGDRIGAGSDTNFTVMAACPGNLLVTRADLDEAVERLVAEARPLVTALLADLEARRGTSVGADGHFGPAGWSDLP